MMTCNPASVAQLEEAYRSLLEKHVNLSIADARRRRSFANQNAGWARNNKRRKMFCARQRQIIDGLKQQLRDAQQACEKFRKERDNLATLLGHKPIHVVAPPPKQENPEDPPTLSAIRSELGRIVDSRR